MGERERELEREKTDGLALEINLGKSPEVGGAHLVKNVLLQKYKTETQMRLRA